MPNPFPTFPLFADPVAEQSFKRSRKKCDCCAKSRGWIYTCSMYGPGDNDHTLCPWCIADGSAARKFKVSFQQATIFPIAKGSPKLSRSDADLVEHRTPGFVTWQDHGWFICCGRACIYIGEASSKDLAGKWASAVPSMFKGPGLKEWSEQDKANLVKSIRRRGSPAAYIFKCQVCSKLQGFWDCD